MCIWRNFKGYFLNCKNIENTYGTDFNVNFINFGKSSCVKEKIDNIHLFNIDINAQEIFNLVKEKRKLI